jgi:tRNA threonylcarbamoyladenosine biosynthesis protein TsaE
MQITTPDEMFAIGKRIGGQVKGGDLILLNGPLGAGKTLLVQGIGAALGFSDITSPTFVISRTHNGPLSLIHVDVYRLLEGDRAAAFLDDLDLDSAAESAVTVIEWGGQESARLSDERLEISIDRSGETREVSINPVGARWAEFSL